ncbi:uncharacterized protein N7459_005111 [Penicillium hispanicum]|uniref:uncharacterized protein n=1 Tax=Penicillium hispanicum TaxID=1080232 RepID=UPI002540F733|nr:uncharacterized protein N7459_005111 [Penicillium hispanicum]KAJ5585311.1 hypothetical protein N7459_005111 [Penicillium hispanicum]
MSPLLNIVVWGAYLWIWGLAWAQNETSPVSSELFKSLEELSRLVDVSYCVGTTGVQEPFECLSHCAEFPDLELATTWNTGVLMSDSCGYIALSHSPSAKRIIVAFRGTYSITNTIIDLSAYPQAYVPYTGDEDDKDRSNGTQPGFSALRCENCTVHAGFMTSWINTRPTVLPHVSAARGQYPDYEVTLVGHSLGGAVAALAGLEMRLKGWNPVVTTFGEPIVGNDAFAKFIDEQFHIEDPNEAPGHATTQRFRRVTHIDDPVPLLPLQEWGYRPHSGEIFISNPDLPPSLQDLHACVGDQDPRCIAGSETPTLLLDMYQDASIPFRVFNSRLDPCPPYPGVSDPTTGQRVALDKQQDRVQVGTAGCASDHVTAPLYPLHWDWSLIPARYRLWELFYAHRDYFWRIGLCVPVGDPTA